MGKYKNKIIFSIILAALVYVGFTIYADYTKLLVAFSEFKLWLIPVLLTLSLLNYFFRFLKWDYYLGVLKINIDKRDSAGIFFSGFIMSITPGKMGEVFKSFLLRELNNTPVSVSASIIFAERVTDFLSLVMLSVTGAVIFGAGIELSILILVLFIIMLLVLGNRKSSLFILDKIDAITPFKRITPVLRNLYESSYTLLKVKPLVLMIFLSLFSWFFECFAYFLILKNYSLDLGLFWASFVYAFGTIIGAVTLLPGGLGITEGSLTYFVVNAGASENVAVASTFIIRAVTLWFSVIVGIVALSLYKKRISNINLNQLN
ncbi:MAG: flippase-like domain-containing protein [Ignavibacteriaceae bacterium]|nr:flippase-like domain-containing protein [Ignavibacteriaceae bacterium]